MEDLSDVIKRKFFGLYKKKTDAFGTVKERVTKMNEQRKINRHDVVHEKRKIPLDMSPVLTPVAKKEKTPQKKEIVKETSAPVPNKRLEMLAKWKAEKERQKQQQKNNSKPIFKVAHVPVNVGLPNLDNVNKEIKGKPFSSKFAPTNHKFKPPANIKPIHFNNPTENKTRDKKKTDTTPIKHRMTTRSQSKSISDTDKVTSEKIKPKVKPEKAKETNGVADRRKGAKKVGRSKEDVRSARKNEAVEKTEPNEEKESTKDKIKEEIKSTSSKEKESAKNKIEEEIKSTSTEETDSPLMSPDYPVDQDNPSSENDDVKTPNKNEPPVYISPFVTISRGKNSARKEYEARKSGTSLSSKSGVIDRTSPEAGAAYFQWLLENQISRLQQLCKEWTSYKEETNPPEEAVSMIDVAIGQTNLLITKKFVQFRGLIDQCKDSDGCPGSPVTCEDLHGFWDMMHIQVINLDKRFGNLETLRTNNWLEIIPEVKKNVVKKKEKPVKNVKASSAIRDAIRAARRQKQSSSEDQEKIEEIKKTPRKSSARLSAMKTEQSGNRRNSSPGLMMMKVAQYAKAVETPAKSILKVENVKSAKSHSKTVLFEDEVSFKVDNLENDVNSSNRSLRAKTPMRPSRLSRSKLF